jgi:predicted RNA-binding Zn-ribbon protein involved in translation (DUF1610 family)
MTAGRRGGAAAPRSKSKGQLPRGSGGDARDVRNHCPNCGLTLVSHQLASCPQCGGLLGRTATTRLDDLSVKVTFRQYACDRCGYVFVLTASGQCPKCGNEEAEAGAADPLAAQRETRWRSRVDAIARVARAADRYGLHFSTRGLRRSPTEYIAWLQEAFFGEAMDGFQRAKVLLRDTEWPLVDLSGDTSLDELHVLLTGIAGFVSEAELTPPPVVLLATHRGSARAAGLLTRSISLFSQVVIAPHLETATAIRAQAQAALDEGAAVAEAISAHLGLLKRVSDEPGWFAWDDAFDTGRATAEVVSHRPSSVKEVVDRVRSTFAAIPEIVALPDHVAFVLAPAVLTSVLWDSLRLERRIKAALAIFHGVFSVNPNWMVRPGLVAQDVAIGHQQLSDQVGQLGFFARSGASRKAMLLGSIGVYERFGEGPLRKFGALVRQAIEVGSGRQQVLDVSAMKEDKLGPIVESLRNAAPVLVQEVSLLLRNASAHYGFEVTDAGIVLTAPPRRGKTPKDELSDDDFMEMLFDLNELLVALEVAILASAHSGTIPQLQAELSGLGTELDQQCQVLRAIAGLRGWVEVTFEKSGNRLIVEGRYIGEPLLDPFAELLPAVAGAFGAIRGLSEIDARLRDTRRTCRFAGARIIEGPKNVLADVARTGRITADTLRQSETQSVSQVEARFLLGGPVAVLLRAIEDNTVSMREVREFCKWESEWLASEPIVEELEADRNLVVQQLKGLERAVAMLESSTRTNRRWLAKLASDEMRSAMNSLREIHVRLRSLYA